jgi:hypothetical protein
MTARCRDEPIAPSHSLGCTLCYCFRDSDGDACDDVMARWRVDIIRKRAEHLGTVEAANAQEAKKIAAREFNISPERQNRITVEKLSKDKE